MSKEDPADAPITPALEPGLLIPTSPMAIIAAAASDPECDVAKMVAIVELQERLQATEAKAAHARAMAQFQAECPVIVKHKQADRYKYAPYEIIMRDAGPVMARCGLSVRFSQELLGDGRLHVTCFVSCGTHTEASEFTCPVDKAVAKTGKPIMNDTQQVGSALSYAKRYALCAAMNIVVAGEDYDGAPPSPAPEADPDAPDAATRDSRDRMGKLYKRYRDAGGPESGWWPMVRKTVGVEDPKVDVTPTPAEWDKVEVVIGEMEGASNG